MNRGPRLTEAQGHVNNVIYGRYAETARVNWVLYFAMRVDPAHGSLWAGLMSTRSVGLIMKSLKTEFKLVGFALVMLKKTCDNPCRSLANRPPFG